jgi:hypothetical protein
MTIGTGQIWMSEIRAELGAGLPFSLSQARGLAGVPSGSMSMSQLRGKSAYTPMTATGFDAMDSQMENGGNTVYLTCHPYVTVSGGSGTKTFLWEFQSNGGGVLTDTTSPTCTVRYESKYGGGVAGYLKCTITDGTGASVVVSNVYYELTVYT